MLCVVVVHRSPVKEVAVTRFPWPVTLRGRVLALFAALAITPLVALGLLDYARARRAVEEIIAVQTDSVAARAAKIVNDRYAIIESDALLLNENAETQRLLIGIAAHDSAGIVSARSAADTFLTTVWKGFHGAYRSIELRDASGSLVRRLADADVPLLPSGEARAPRLRFPVAALGSIMPIGSLALEPLPESIVPAELAQATFGHSGYLTIVDRPTGHIIYDTRGPATGMSVTEALGAGGAEQFSGRSGPYRYVAGGSERIASVTSLATPAWMFIASTAVTEFTQGLADLRLLDLALIALMAIAATIAFTVLLGKTTRSLEQLTGAAGAFGRGEPTPALPPQGNDEVGQLSGAFATMTTRVNTMLREIAVSRQLAVLGEFSAQLSHEIRNPLTSIKLNLQSLSRDVERGSLSEYAGAPLNTCLREVGRLERVVRGVLLLANTRDREQTICRVHTLVDHVTVLLQPQLNEHCITLRRNFGATNDAIAGNEEQLIGMFMNLIVNAIEAQPTGGVIFIETATVDEDSGTDLRVVIADNGPGIAEGERERIFRPFVTGRATGTGLGLAMALATAREHGGHLDLISAPEGYRGAAFAVTLPLAKSHVVS
jgi:signal transduction histidine kinase